MSEISLRPNNLNGFGGDPNVGNMPPAPPASEGASRFGGVDLSLLSMPNRDFFGDPTDNGVDYDLNTWAEQMGAGQASEAPRLTKEQMVAEAAVRDAVEAACTGSPESLRDLAEGRVPNGVDGEYAINRARASLDNLERQPTAPEGRLGGKVLEFTIGPEGVFSWVNDKGYRARHTALYQPRHAAPDEVQSTTFSWLPHSDN